MTLNILICDLCINTLFWYLTNTIIKHGFRDFIDLLIWNFYLDGRHKLIGYAWLVVQYSTSPLAFLMPCVIARMNKTNVFSVWFLRRIATRRRHFLRVVAQINAPAFQFASKCESHCCFSSRSFLITPLWLILWNTSFDLKCLQKYILYRSVLFQAISRQVSMSSFWNDRWDFFK